MTWYLKYCTRGSSEIRIHHMELPTQPTFEEGGLAKKLARGNFESIDLFQKPFRTL